MIKKLRMQITIIIGAVLTVFLCLIVTGVNIMNYSISINRLYNALEITAATNGEVSTDYIQGSDLTSDQMFYRSLSFYSVLLDNKNELMTVKNKDNSGYSDDELLDLAKSIVKAGMGRGLTTENEAFVTRKFIGGVIVVFVDANSVVSNVKSTLEYSIIIGVIGIAAIWWLSFVLAKLIVMPVKTAFDKQKTFISDAGHELKTPVAVIMANAEVLESETGSNKWISYIKSETKRMNTLIQSLLTLSKMEDGGEKIDFKPFDISRAAEGAALPFEVIAYDKKAVFEYNIQENVIFNGNEDKIKQLFAILIDNAVKHCYDEGKIIVSVSKIRNKITASVSNTGDPIPPEERDKIFERFYRVDKARNRDEGRYGLGLAIAKSIVQIHNGEIFVNCDNGFTTFKVVF